MKLGGIKGEFASNVSVTYREDGANRFTGKRLNWDAICDVGTAIKQESVADSLTNPEHELGLDVGPVNQGADVWTNGSATSIKNTGPSDYNHGKRSNWDVICDVGTFIKQSVDLRAHGAVHQDTPMDTHPNDYITTIGQQGYTEVEWTYLKDGVGKNDIPQDVHPNQLADGLLQQPSDIAGLINPDSMRPAEYFSHNLEWFAPGSAVDAVGASNPMGLQSNQMMGSISPISRGDMFAPTNIVIRENAN